MGLFLLYTIVAAIGTGCFIAEILWPSIQQDQIFGRWQNVLDNLSRKGYGDVAKFLGHCELCFSHFISVLSYIVFYLFCKHVLGYWLTQNVDILALKILFSLGWWFIYGGISVTISLWLLRRKNT
jgi:hypothetical protein